MQPRVALDEQEAPFDVAPLLEALSAQGGTFVSDKVERTGRDAYRAYGRYELAGKRGTGFIPFKFRGGANVSEIKVGSTKALDEAIPGVPLPVVPGASEGSVDSTIVFRAGAPLTT